MKCICFGRCWLIGICTLQLITIAVRQTFDILGLQWSCIIVNFCQFAAIIMGFFGVCQHKRSILAVYNAWSLIWMGWNVLIICVYRDIIHTERPSMILNLDISDSVTWFKTHTYNCSSSLVTESEVDQKFCIDDFRYIEIFQSGLQLLLSVFGFIASCYVMGNIKEDQDHDFDFSLSTKKNNDENGAPSSIRLLSTV